MLIFGFGPLPALGPAGAGWELVIPFAGGSVVMIWYLRSRAMVGTNWGAQQYRRACEIAWTGAATVALLCGTIGLIVAFQPSLWIGLFSDDAEVARLGALYLRIVGPAYLCFGLGLGLFYVMQGVGRRRAGSPPFARRRSRRASRSFSTRGRTCFFARAATRHNLSAKLWTGRRPTQPRALSGSSFPGC